MRHVIYRTEYFNRAGEFLRDEESDAYFNTMEGDPTLEFEAKPPIGCRLLQPKLVPNRLSKEQWKVLRSEKSDYELKYASLYDVDENQYAIYAISERVFKDEESNEVYILSVSMGSNDEVCLHLLVLPIDYDLGDNHITRWDAIDYDGITPIKTDDCVHIVSDKEVTIFYKDFVIKGKWESMEQISQYEFVYHCRNSLFPFDISINLQREDSWSDNYEDYLK